MPALLTLLAATVLAATGPTVLPRAYAHNDYRHSTPLFDALDRGFMAVEADVHLRSGELLLGHRGGDVRPGVTLESHYLRPLRDRARSNGGVIHAGGPKGFLLMVEFKSDPEPSYAALERLLKNYSDVLTRFTSSDVEENAVTVLITGRRPDKLLRGQSPRWAAIDGDPGDFGDGHPTLFPVISDNWAARFEWRGGAMNEAEREKLARFVSRAHEKGRKLRFWGTPDREETWALLHGAGVDYLNTDRLDDLRDFLLSRPR